MHTTIVRAVLLLCSLCCLGRAPAAGAQTTADEPGRFRLGSADVTLSGRVQAQLNTTSVPGERDAEWLMRRARVEFRVQVNELVGGKLQPDFAGDRFTLKDAYMDLAFSPALRVLVGQAHRPFGLLTRYSSLRMPPIEKGAELRGVVAWDELNLVKNLGYSNRDVGIQAMGALPGLPLGLQYEVAVLQGPAAPRVTDGGTMQVVARLAASPLPNVTVGGSWSRRDFVGPVSGGIRAGDALAVDVAYEPSTPGLLLLGELASGDFDPWSGATFRGAHVWAAYDLVPRSGRVSMVEPLLRVSHGELEREAGSAGGTLLTPGLNLYLGGLNRVMLNYEVWLPAADASPVRSLKAMFQLAF